ncbi:MAG: cupin domain-containing protein [Spirochaetota bacterium]
MAYIFNEKELPKLVSAVPGRERIFFVSKELSHTDEMLCGVTFYDKNAQSPYHMHENCEHFYFILEGKGVVETEEERREIGPGELVYFPSLDKHRLKALDGPLKYIEYQAPNRFKTTIIEGSEENLRWEQVDGKVWYQS